MSKLIINQGGPTEGWCLLDRLDYNSATSANGTLTFYPNSFRKVKVVLSLCADLVDNEELLVSLKPNGVSSDCLVNRTFLRSGTATDQVVNPVDIQLARVGFARPAYATMEGDFYNTGHNRSFIVLSTGGDYTSAHYSWGETSFYRWNNTSDNLSYFSVEGSQTVTSLTGSIELFGR